MDNTDKSILRELQQNARISTAELARQIGLSTSATSERIARLERDGIIRGYTALVDCSSLGLNVTAFILVPVGNSPIEEMGMVISQFPHVLECHKVTGNTCFLVKVRVPGMDQLEEIIDSINRVASNTYSYVVLSTFKESAQLTIPAGEES